MVWKPSRPECLIVCCDDHRVVLAVLIAVHCFRGWLGRLAVVEQAAVVVIHQASVSADLAPPLKGIAHLDDMQITEVGVL